MQTDIEQTIRRYLAASAGTANNPTDYTIRCFIGMIEGNECDIGLFQKVGGDWLVERIKQYATEIGSIVE